jgi:hypothetical protein
MLTNFWRKVYKKLSRKVLTSKVKRHKEPSLIFSPDNNTNDFLIDLSLEAIKLAWKESIEVPNKSLPDAAFYNIYPGEHYRLLKALSKILDPKVIVEIGTFTGMGSVAFLQGQKQGNLYTYDIFPWDSFASHLTQSDFVGDKLFQVMADLSNADQFQKNIEILNNAEIIFMDAPKDGVFEYQFTSLLSKLQPKKNKLLILDDIRFVNMIDLWMNIDSPKLDVSSFGHWSGTGLVDISEGFKLKKS